MKFATVVLAFGMCGGVAGAQMMGAAAESQDAKAQDAKAKAPESTMSDSTMMMSESAQTAQDEEQKKATAALAAKANQAMAPKVSTKVVTLTPLSPRERVVQLLDRFTYGPRPGDVDAVLAQGGNAWLEQQLAPDAIKDGAMDGRLKAYPTQAMSAGDIAMTFPQGQAYQVADGRIPYPADPLLNAVYEVQVYNVEQDKDRKDENGKVIAKIFPTEEEAAEKRKADKVAASKIYGELLALPKEQRMAALIKMPVEDRIVFTEGGALTGDQKNLFYSDLNPREKEAFDGMASHINSGGRTTQEQAEARLLRDVLSERQLQQVMTNFWFNHFNVYADKDSDRWYAPVYERDVIRKNALGKFKDLLLATAESPAMQVYLDNYLSIGPDSMANGVYVDKPESKKGAKGLNENYGREVMELHTVGVNGGYSQADVTALAAILTGWGVERPSQGGGFAFDPKRHEPGTKYWFGYRIDDDGTVTKLAAGAPAPKVTFGPGVQPETKVAANADSVKQGIAALTILAQSPQTARFISTLLAQYFVADNPPAALVDRLTKTYLASDGDIKTMIRAIATSPEFNSKQYFHNKVKTPEEFIASSLRTTATDPKQMGLLVGTIGNMGEKLYYALPPTGYYLTADQWMSSVALVSRLNFAYSLTNNKFGGQPFDAPKLLAMALMTPSGSNEVSGAGAKVVSVPAVVKDPKEKLIGFTTPAKPADTPKPALLPSGTAVTLHVLEQTMIGSPVSAQTNQLIAKQVEQQPAGATAMDTLNLLTALVMGSPEFQTR